MACELAQARQRLCQRSLGKFFLDAQITATDRLVYELYELTDEKIALVEQSG